MLVALRTEAFYCVHRSRPVSFNRLAYEGECGGEDIGVDLVAEFSWQTEERGGLDGARANTAANC
jgi:hypothetical protein